MDRDVYMRMDALEEQHWWFSARRGILAEIIQSILTVDKSKAHILEAGCGSGGNIRMLRTFGSVKAFEFDKVARETAIRKCGIEIAPGALPNNLPYVGEKFDLIGIFDVLEHVEKDVESLDALARRLASGGKILVTVPAFPSLWSEHDVTHHHFRRYTRKSLAEVAKKAGLKVSYVSYFNFFLYPAAIVTRALKRLAGRKTPDDALPGVSLNRILKCIFGLERYLLGRMSFPVGLSLVAVLEPI